MSSSISMKPCLMMVWIVPFFNILNEQSQKPAETGIECADLRSVLNQLVYSVPDCVVLGLPQQISLAAFENVAEQPETVQHLHVFAAACSQNFSLFLNGAVLKHLADELLVDMFWPVPEYGCQHAEGLVS